MSEVLTLTDLIAEALKHGATVFKIQTGLHPMIFSAKGVQAYDTQRTSYDEVDELLRHLVSSREMREFRAGDEVHFTTVFGKSTPLVGVAKLRRDVVKDEMLVEFDASVSLQRVSA
jgi:Tfp pilus assembly pilus retraction ATPase PilT